MIFDTARKQIKFKTFGAETIFLSTGPINYTTWNWRFVRKCWFSRFCKKHSKERENAENEQKHGKGERERATNHRLSQGIPSKSLENRVGGAGDLTRVGPFCLDRRVRLCRLRLSARCSAPGSAIRHVSQPYVWAMFANICHDRGQFQRESLCWSCSIFSFSLAFFIFRFASFVFSLSLGGFCWISNILLLRPRQLYFNIVLCGFGEVLVRWLGDL